MHFPSEWISPREVCRAPSAGASDTMCIYIYIYTSICVYIYIYIHTYVCVYIYIYIHTHVCAYIYIYIYSYVCVYIYLSIYLRTSNPQGWWQAYVQICHSRFIRESASQVSLSIRKFTQKPPCAKPPFRSPSKRLIIILAIINSYE